MSFNSTEQFETSNGINVEGLQRTRTGNILTLILNS